MIKLRLHSVHEYRAAPDFANVTKLVFLSEVDKRYTLNVKMELLDFEARRKWYDVVCGFIAAKRCNQRLYIVLDEPLVGTELSETADFRIVLEDRRPTWTPIRPHTYKKEIFRKDFQ